MIHCLRITPVLHAIRALLTTHHWPNPIPTPLLFEALSLFPRVHSLSWFIPPSVYRPPFLLPFLLLPIFLLLMFMFHKWVKPYDNCLSLLDLLRLALSPPVSSMLQQMWEIVLFDGWVIFPCMYAPHLLNPVLCWRESQLLPWFSYCGQCCYGHWVHMALLFTTSVSLG